MTTQFSQCSCCGGNLDKLIKPVVLGFLAQESLHGYALLAKLGQSRIFDGDTALPDASGVYRLLNEMLDQGLISSVIDTDSHGPAKRVFSITEKGKECLKTWYKTLCDYRNRINRIRRLIKDALPDTDSL